EAVFNLFFRKNPFKGGFTVSCGLDYVVDYVNNFHFSESDLEYLASIQGNDNNPLFEEGFLHYLQKLEFSCDLEAVPEGTLVFPHEPLIKVKGPIIQCQLLETPLLNLINFQTLIATKAARIRNAAKMEPVSEFGLRRAQGIDGALAASRAAYIGGVDSTSNVLAGKLFGIPLRGTHAHSWVMSFETELEAFKTYAEALPNNCIFLVDTYDTIQGIKNAITVGKMLREKGKEMIGVRIDSGDLAYLSQKARNLLDEAGFPNARIVGSNDLDETIVNSLKLQEAHINTWGIGTKLVTAFDQPALGGVYKMSAIKEGKKWIGKVKLSEQAIKVNNPGLQQVRRFYLENECVADAIFDQRFEPKETFTILDPLDPTRQKKLDTKKLAYKDLLIPIFDKGKQVYQSPKLEEIRNHLQKEMSTFHSGIKRFVNPHRYPVGLEENLHQLKTELILNLRKKVRK
ncbi:nicotinate phosphoribosyltransferase, partial [Xanthovirga aplysinae]|uniref:nicotinate phosphoribosyltransferase n=1 Tax=Xanthovirga aplysinae TaxID=2529853 RepID=UPI0012BC7826